MSSAIINGHYHGSSLNFVGFDDNNDGINDRVVYQICTDYQSAPEGGMSYIKMIYFDLANDKICMNSYSPTLDDFNYYDAPKLASYGIGTIAADIDITELSVDFDRDIEKTLNVSSVSVSGLTSAELGSATRSGTNTKVTINAKTSGKVNVYAVLKDSDGNILGYTDTMSFTVSGTSQGDTGSHTNPGTSTNSDTESSTQGNTTTIGKTVTSTTDSSGKSSASVDSNTVSALISGATAAEGAGKKAVVEIKVEMAVSATAMEVSIPRDAFSSLADNTNADLTVDAGISSVTFDASAIDYVNAAASSGAISITIAEADTSSLPEEARGQIGNRPVYDFTVTSGSQTISSFGDGSANISIPYAPSADEDPNAIVVYYISDIGELQTVQGKYNASTGTVEFTTTHFSTYAVGYNKLTFVDVSTTDWYCDAITFIAARGITTGTGDGAFSPDSTLTRGQFIVMLMRAYGIQAEANPADNFDDAGDTYYTSYLATAKQLGISNGDGDNNFMPNSEITRQDMFTLLYRALDVLGELPTANTSKTVKNFGDADQISAYAMDSMNALVESGIISGNNGNLDPTGTSSRAQMAQVLVQPSLGLSVEKLSITDCKHKRSHFSFMSEEQPCCSVPQGCFM